MTTTPNLGLNLPTVGADRDTWGALLNDNTSTIDSLLFMAMPIGMICDFGGPNAPPGWLIADGRAISRTTYSALFAVLGTYWGAGDGVSTFNLPNPNGRAVVGPGTVIDQNGTTLSFSFTQRTGDFYYPVLQAHLPNYALVVSTVAAHNHGGFSANAGAHSHTIDIAGAHAHGGLTGSTTPGVSDPGHAHGYSDWYTGGTGSIAGGATFGNVSDTSRVTNAQYANITVAAHTHTISVDGGHTHNISTYPVHQHQINADGGHSHAVTLGGGGQWFPLIQPILVVTKIIFAGQQAVAHVLTAASAPATMRRLSAPLRGRH